MSVKENLRIVDAQTEATNTRDWDRLAELYKSTVYYTPDRPEPYKGKELIDRFKRLFTAFPDFRSEKELAFGEGDWVCKEATVTGTHKGPFLGPGGKTIPPTNKRVRITVCKVFKFEGGKITEIHEHRDRLALMAQLGLVP